jgi:hypothetical protein
MKINVTPENGLGTYNVSLHWETKDKIKKILGYGLLMAAGATAAWHYTHQPRTKTRPTPSKSQQLESLTRILVFPLAG